MSGSLHNTGIPGLEAREPGELGPAQQTESGRQQDAEKGSVQHRGALPLIPEALRHDSTFFDGMRLARKRSFNL